MFEQTLAVPVRANRACATMLGFATQTLVVTLAVAIPIIFPDSLPRVQTVVSLFTPTAPLAPAPPAPSLPSTVAKVRDLQIRNGILIEPTRVPPKARMIEEEPLTAAEMATGGGIVGGVIGGSKDGIQGGLQNVIGGSVALLPKPPAPAKADVAPPKPAVAVAPKVPLKVGGEVQEAKLIHRVIPPYPPLAKQARISGLVQLTGWIGTNGRIRELKVLSGHPLLVPAAVEAVSRWVYQPTLLNSEPVEVVAPISVNFILN